MISGSDHNSSLSILNSPHTLTSVALALDRDLRPAFLVSPVPESLNLIFHVQPTQLGENFDNVCSLYLSSNEKELWPHEEISNFAFLPR